MKPTRSLVIGKVNSQTINTELYNEPFRDFQFDGYLNQFQMVIFVISVLFYSRMFFFKHF